MYYQVSFQNKITFIIQDLGKDFKVHFFQFRMGYEQRSPEKQRGRLYNITLVSIAFVC